MRKSFNAVFGLIILTSVSARGASADTGDHWCEFSSPWSWSNYDAIPVWIHPDMADVWLRHATGVKWTDAELRAEVEFVIERFKMQAPSAMPPLYFAGFEYAGTGWDDPAGNGPGGTPGPGNLAIRPNLGYPTKAPNYCASFKAGSPSDAKGVRLWMGVDTDDCMPNEPGNEGEGNSSEHWFYSGSSNLIRTFGGTLAHELMHGIGFDHTESCNKIYPYCLDNPGQPSICGLMDTHGLGSEYYELEYADFDGIVEKYGGWENESRFRRESVDATTWSTVTGTSIASAPFTSSTWSMTSTLLPIVVTNSSTLDPHVYRWERSTGLFTDWGYPTTSGYQLGQLGVAYKPGYLFAFHASGQSANYSRKFSQYSWATSPPNNWTTLLTANYIDRLGVQGA